MLEPADEQIYRRIREEAYSMGIGRTPILKIPIKKDVTIFAKLEYFNKYGSVKDRAAFFMLKKAQIEGATKGDKIVIEGSSGNTGIAIASIARDLGIDAEIVIPPGISEGTKQRLKETGGTIVETLDDGTPGARNSTAMAIAEARKIAGEYPETYFTLFQHGNEANMLAHYYTTGPEVEEAIGLVPEIAVIGMGTGGTITGLSKYLKSRNPRARVYAVQNHPESYIQGIRNYKLAKEKKLIEDHIDLIDEFMEVTEEEAYSEVKYLLEKHEVFVGTSSGANLAGARRVAESIESGNILTVFPDSAEKYESVYASKGVFTEEEYNKNVRYFIEVPSKAITLV